MSQILANTPETTLFQDFSIKRENSPLKSSANSVRCHVCGRGLEHGGTISAKNHNSKTEFFCNIHF